MYKWDSILFKSNNILINNVVIDVFKNVVFIVIRKELYIFEL